MKTSSLLMAVGAMAVVGFGAIFFLVPRLSQERAVTPSTLIDAAFVPDATYAPVDLPLIPAGELPLSESRPETVNAGPVAYFPPPSINLTGGMLGRQVVPGTDGIGDISQLYFNDYDQALYAAVVETTGMRSVWRLTEKGAFERVFADDLRGGEIRLRSDGHGVLYVMLNSPDRVYRTADTFKTWHKVMEGKGIFWNVASDGKGTTYGTLHSYNEPVLYRSPDNGFSWEPWVDFAKVLPRDAVPYAEGDERNRLRHLHDVIYNDKTNSLVVGTGDVARYTLQSDDDGKTWRKIWDEGFTAHTVVSGGSRYLLCPDKLRGPGIALYDAWAKTMTETFSPGAHGIAGYCYSMSNVDGIYYAAFHTEANEVESIVPKSAIVASPDGERWYPFLEWDPLTNHARTDIWLASAPGRVYAAINGRLYAFAPLDKAWFEGKKAFER